MNVIVLVYVSGSMQLLRQLIVHAIEIFLSINEVSLIGTKAQIGWRVANALHCVMAHEVYSNYLIQVQLEVIAIRFNDVTSIGISINIILLPVVCRDQSAVTMYFDPFQISSWMFRVWLTITPSNSPCSIYSTMPISPTSQWLIFDLLERSRCCLQSNRSIVPTFFGTCISSHYLY